MSKIQIERSKYPIVIIISVVVLVVVINLLVFLFNMGRAICIATFSGCARQEVLNPTITEDTFNSEVSMLLMKAYRANMMLLDVYMKLEDIEQPFTTIEEILDNIVMTLDSISTELIRLNPTSNTSREKKLQLLTQISEAKMQARETKMLIATGDKSIIQRGIRGTMNRIDRLIEANIK